MQVETCGENGQHFLLKIVIFKLAKQHHGWPDSQTKIGYDAGEDLNYALSEKTQNTKFRFMQEHFNKRMVNIKKFF